MLKVTAATLFSLILLEALVRVLLPQELPHDVPELWSPDHSIGWKHRAGIRVTANTGERDVEICIDGDGDRVDCHREPQKYCSRRILIVGDSFVEALAIPYREAVWARIEEDTGACLSVAGVSGYGLAQYTETVRQHTGEHSDRYDLVILNVFVGNDFTIDAKRMPAPDGGAA